MFSIATLDFLDELAAHNERAWFESNKARYEALVREPALAFIVAMAPALSAFAPRFRADPRRTGGSLMRVYRDTRFARNKAPYKTNVGIQFRHELGRDVHAPGFYLHIASDGCFLAAGCWHPESAALGRIRQRVAEETPQWLAARDAQPFAEHWRLDGDTLTRPPRGYDSAHPAIADIRRKDFIAVAPLAFDEVIGPQLVDLAGRRFAEAAPLMAFLCEALGVPW